MNLAPRGKRGSVVELIDAMGVAAVVVALFIFALAIVGGREDDRPAAPAAEPEAPAAKKARGGKAKAAPDPPEPEPRRGGRRR